jgi:kynurenine formamidase
MHHGAGPEDQAGTGGQIPAGAEAAPAGAPAANVAGAEHQLVYESLLERDGVRVSRSPWGPDDQIGRLNWITPESRRAVLERLDGRATFDLSVDYVLGMPSWLAAGDPPYGIWMTHTPDGSRNEDLGARGPDVLSKYSYAGDSIAMYTHCGTHIDTLNHRGYYGTFWNGWTAQEDLGSRHWLKGGAEHYPPIVARATLLDVAGLHGVDCLPDGYAITPADLRAAARSQGTQLQSGTVVHVRTGRMGHWPDPDRYLPNSPGLGLAAARFLCEEVGAMCVASDSIALEVLPSEEEGAFMPVHSYLLATAGAQIMEVVNMEEIAAEKMYDFAVLAFPLKLAGATGAPLRPVAVPIRS